MSNIYEREQCVSYNERSTSHPHIMDEFVASGSEDILRWLQTQLNVYTPSGKSEARIEVLVRELKNRGAETPVIWHLLTLRSQGDRVVDAEGEYVSRFGRTSFQRAVMLVLKDAPQEVQAVTGPRKREFEKLTGWTPTEESLKLITGNDG